MVSIFITEYLVAHQFSDFFLLKSYSAVLELFGIKELDLSDTNQQRGSTDSIQTTSGAFYYCSVLLQRHFVLPYISNKFMLVLENITF